MYSSGSVYPVLVAYTDNNLVNIQYTDVVY